MRVNLIPQECTEKQSNRIMAGQNHLEKPFMFNLTGRVSAIRLGFMILPCHDSVWPSLREVMPVDVDLLKRTRHRATKGLVCAGTVFRSGALYAAREPKRPSPPQNEWPAVPTDRQ